MKRGIIAIVLALVLLCGAALADTGWIMCKPGDFVNVRMKPGKRSSAVGFLENGDRFETDWKRKNGFIRTENVGENDAGWIFAGFVSDEKPAAVFERYVCVARTRAACRRWINGPRIRGRSGWLYNGTTVTVYYRTEEWCCTSRGYIRSEWLEADP